MSNNLRKPKSNFTVVSNEILRDPKISLKAIGIYVFMMSKPDNWNFTINSISKQVKDGTDSVSTALNELKKAGYLMYTKHKDGTGTYELFTRAKTENPDIEIPNLGNPTCISNTILEVNKDNNKPQTPKGDSNGIDFAGLISFLNSKTGREFRVIPKAVKQKYRARLKDGYTKHDIFRAISAACAVQSHKENGYQYLTPEFFSRASTLDKYGVPKSTSETGEKPYCPTA